MSLMVSLFDRTGIMARPWAEAGFMCVCFDIANDDRVERVGRGKIVWRAVNLAHPNMARDMLTFCDPPSFVAAFPPCTHLAVSGARWFRGKGLRALQEAVGYFATAAELCTEWGAPYLIENPVSTMATYWRAPDYSFHPHDYAGLCSEDTYTKKTCLWTGNGFVMPPPCPLEGVEPDDRIHKAPPGPDRAAFRSATPLGFARAVFASNAPRRAAA